MMVENLFSDPIYFCRMILIVIFSIVMHELAHGWAAISQGDDTPKRTGHLTLNPLVHMGWESIIFLCLAGIAWGQMPINPCRFRHPKWSNILVSVAGPVSNLVLSIIFMLLLRCNFSFISNDFLYLGAYTNICLFMFNLLPFPPLDGFHIVSEFFPELKVLENSFLGMFTLTFLFIGGVPDGLSLLANAVIQTVAPLLT